MAIQSVFVLNKAGGLVYHTDCNKLKTDVEKTFSYPLDIVLKEDDKLTVVFGERDGIKGSDIDEITFKNIFFLFLFYHYESY